mmetsp:Transcript_5987/g.17970  ORF Transcript_5987/g.17970 Transcript_5987/m.17970 type:complete len:338 (+) Transcript_5987:172-1185(+)
MSDRDVCRALWLTEWAGDKGLSQRSLRQACRGDALGCCHGQTVVQVSVTRVREVSHADVIVPSRARQNRNLRRRLCGHVAHPHQPGRPPAEILHPLVELHIGVALLFGLLAGHPHVARFAQHHGPREIDAAHFDAAHLVNGVTRRKNAATQRSCHPPGPHAHRGAAARHPTDGLVPTVAHADSPRFILRLHLYLVPCPGVQRPELDRRRGARQALSYQAFLNRESPDRGKHVAAVSMGRIDSKTFDLALHELNKNVLLSILVRALHDHGFVRRRTPPTYPIDAIHVPAPHQPCRDELAPMIQSTVRRVLHLRSNEGIEGRWNSLEVAPKEQRAFRSP